MAKLDVMGTVTEAYKGAWSHFGDMVKLVWLPVVIYLAASIMHASFVQTQMQGVDTDDRQAMMAALANIFASWQTITLFLLSMFLWSVIAVAWHRFILLGETSPKFAYFRFGRREAMYLITSIFLTLIFLPGILISLQVQTMPEGDATAALFALLGMALLLAGIFFAVRLALVLPAVATDGAVDAKGILEATEGNFWRMAATHAINFLGIMVLNIVFEMAASALNDVTGGAVGIIAGVVLMIFVQILSVAILSIMYRDLVLNRTPHSPV